MPSSFHTFIAPGARSRVSCVAWVYVKDVFDSEHVLRALRELNYVPPKEKVCAAVRLSGEIVAGDARALLSLIDNNLPFLGSMELDSNGGSVREALEIGRIARRYYLATNAPTLTYGRRFWFSGGKMTEAPKAICASACFFVWVGGVARLGNVIGIHRPFPPDPELAQLSPIQAEDLYRSLSSSIQDYLSEMGVSSHWLDDMMNTSPVDIHMLSEAEAQELGGNFRAGFDVPSINQWALAKCGVLSNEEWNDLWDLSAQSANDKLPTKYRGYLGYLNDKFERMDSCRFSSLVIARWKLHR